jgi:hypothetical protein
MVRQTGALKKADNEAWLVPDGTCNRNIEVANFDVGITLRNV